MSLTATTAIPEEFKDCGKEAGIFVWRIEKLLPVPWPKEKYGEFLNGDAYLVLHVCSVLFSVCFTVF